MGPSSSTGLPFLIERSDTRKFSYHRVLPNDLAPLVAGPVELLWASKIIELEGRTAIKISLKTGDEAMARIRWQSVHTQVEALVQLATIRVRSNRAAELIGRVSALKPADIRAMAGQVRHDILADDDKTYIDPTFTTPLNEIVFDLLRKAGRPDDRATRAAGDRMRGRRRLADALAITTGHGLAHMLDDLPSARLAFEALGDDLAELTQPRAATLPQTQGEG